MKRPFPQDEDVLFTGMKSEVGGPVHCESKADGAFGIGCQPLNDDFIGKRSKHLAGVMNAIHGIGHANYPGIEIELSAVFRDRSLLRRVEIKVAKGAVARHPRRNANHVLLDLLFGSGDLCAIDSPRFQKQLANLWKPLMGTWIQAIGPAPLPQR